MIPYSIPKFSDFHILSQTELLRNPTLHSGTHLYSLYLGLRPPPPPGRINEQQIEYINQLVALDSITTIYSGNPFVYMILKAGVH